MSKQCLMSSLKDMILCLTCTVLRLWLSNAHLSTTGNKSVLVERLRQYEASLQQGSSGLANVHHPVMLLTTTSHDSCKSSETHFVGQITLSPLTPSSAAIGTGLVPVPSTQGGSYALLEPRDMAINLTFTSSLCTHYS